MPQGKGLNSSQSVQNIFPLEKQDPVVIFLCLNLIKNLRIYRLFGSAESSSIMQEQDSDDGTSVSSPAHVGESTAWREPGKHRCSPRMPRKLPCSGGVREVWDAFQGRAARSPLLSLLYCQLVPWADQRFRHAKRIRSEAEGTWSYSSKILGGDSVLSCFNYRKESVEKFEKTMKELGQRKQNLKRPTLFKVHFMYLCGLTGGTWWQPSTMSSVTTTFLVFHGLFGLFCPRILASFPFIIQQHDISLPINSHSFSVGV